MDLQKPSQMMPEEFNELVQRVTIRITKQVAKIDLSCSDNSLDIAKEPCTVYTTLDGTYHTNLIFCAEKEFLRRMTENMMGEPIQYADDVEEYSKEFFNILCGHIVREVHKETKSGASFYPPCFVDGHYAPDMPEHCAEAMIWFTSNHSENMVLVRDSIQFSHTADVHGKEH